MNFTLPNFDKVHVLVVGDLIFDRYWHGPVERISPEAPVPVVTVRETIDKPGGAANVALNIATLGSQVSLVGVTGQDSESTTLVRTLENAGVNCHIIASPQDKTITKFRVISRQQQLMRLDFEKPIDPANAAQLKQRVEALLDQVDILVLSDYNKGTLADPGALIKMARARNIPVLVDPKGNHFEKYHGATLLTPNMTELETIVGRCADETTLVQRGHELRHQLGLEALVITRSEQGMTLLREQENELHLPAQTREVYDVTGAGDTVIALLATALAAGLELPKAVALANIGAGIVVAKLGAATVSVLELASTLSHTHSMKRGTMSPEQLMMAVDSARANGQKIVFTNGCFDILHAGHVSYLEQTRKLGDRLIVAVNDDASVTRLKGEGRPINPLERRMAVLAALESVNWVVAFSEDTPLALLEKVQPDVLVKGGDYTEEEVVGASLVREAGGEVVLIDFVENCSTTEIVRKINTVDPEPADIKNDFCS